MRKLLVLIINNCLIVTLIQSPTWCDIWNQTETLLTTLNQNLPPIVKAGLTSYIGLIVQVNSIIKRCLFRPLTIYLVFTVVKITYTVCCDTGYYNYNPVFIKNKGFLFQAYNACEALTYLIIRDFATQNPSTRYVVYSFCIIFTIRALNAPLTLLIITYFWWIHGWSNLRYLVDRETQYLNLMLRFKFKRLTFQRWEVIYNGGELGPYTKKLLFDVRTAAKIDGLTTHFYRTGWGGSGVPHYTNTNMRDKSDWSPSLDKGHSLTHTSNLTGGSKVANTVHALVTEGAKKPGFFLPSTDLRWVDVNKFKEVGAFDLYLGFYTFYKDTDEFHNLLYNKWSFPAVTELKYHNDIYYFRLESLLTEEGLGKDALNEEFIEEIRRSLL